MNTQKWYEKYDKVASELFNDKIAFDKMTLPGLQTFRTMESESTEPPEEIIGGILRKGRKMLLSGPSKSAKSCLLMELAAAISAGTTWLGYPCKKGKVLYVNLELDTSTASERFTCIFDELGIDRGDEDDYDSSANNLCVWNLRGYSKPLPALAEPLAYICTQEDIDVVIIDPIYKVLTGDENNAGEIGKVCNELDWIAQEGDCAVIFSHHHSKGAKGNRQVLDRSSGSGVFGRDPDAIMDLIQLEPSAAALDHMGGGQITAWRMEAVLREFPSIEPINCWFRFPIHTVDTEGLLDNTAAIGSPKANLNKSSKRVSKEDREAAFNQAFEALSEDGRPVKLADMAAQMGVTQQTVRNRFEELKDQYWLENKMIGKLAKSA